MSAILSLFGLQVAFAFALLTFAVSRRSLGNGFAQLHLTIAAVFGVLALTAPATPLAPLNFVALGLVVLAAFAYTFLPRIAPPLQAGACAAYGVALIVAAAALGARVGWQGGASEGAALYAIGALLSGFVLAQATLGMNVGHWYLVNPRLATEHLTQSAGLLTFFMLLRILFVVPSLVVFLGTLGDDGTGSLRLFMVLSRLVVGFVAPVVMSYMAFVTAQMRATQSATGLLFALLVLLIIGEFLGAFLTLVTGLPW